MLLICQNVLYLILRNIAQLARNFTTAERRIPREGGQNFLGSVLGSFMGSARFRGKGDSILWEGKLNP